ncbi:MAG: methyltransferase domain-containing protein [Chloroflexota bacterium]
MNILNQWLMQDPVGRHSLHEMSRHFPPGGADLRVLDLSSGSNNVALQLLDFRPDLRIIGVGLAVRRLRVARQASLKAAKTDRLDWLQANGTCLPFLENSIDAITAYHFFDTLGEPNMFLREALRVLRPGGRLLMLNPLADRFRRQRRYSLEAMSTILMQAGFARVLAERAAEGRAVFSRGEKPYTARSTVERIAQTADLDESSDGLQIIDAAALQTALRGKFIFVLVRQTPDRPAWDLQSGESLRWQAAMVNDQTQPYVLAFSTLPKAVAFMQPAVTSGILTGINKIAKFDKTVAADWGADLLLNPPLESLRTSESYAFNVVQLDLDPARAITGEE